MFNAIGSFYKRLAGFVWSVIDERLIEITQKCNSPYKNGIRNESEPLQSRSYQPTSVFVVRQQPYGGGGYGDVLPEGSPV